jgi:cytochrome P450
MSYLDRYDAAAPADKHALVRGWMEKEPLPFFKELRQKRPILATPQCTLVSLFDDITEMLNMPLIFNASLYIPKMSKGLYLMSHDDDALHTREKSLMQALLNRDDLPRVRATVSASANGILLAANGKIEAVNEYCRMVPAMLVRDYFGLTGVDLKELMEWSYWNQEDCFYNQPFDIVSDEKRRHVEQKHSEAGEKLTAYIKELILHRVLAIKAEQVANVALAGWHLLQHLEQKVMGEKPPPPAADDIVSRMVRSSFPAAVDFDITRLGINAGGLLIGTIETTSQAVAQVIQFLLADPALAARASAAAKREDPRDIDGIVWEALRYVPIASYLFRTTAQDYTVGKGTTRATTIKAGTYVLLLTQSAMFDERAFENPDQFIPGRNLYHNFTFGLGSHECLGRYVGMMMIPEMVRQILLMPGLKASGPIDYKGEHLPQRYELSWNVR